MTQAKPAREVWASHIMQALTDSTKSSYHLSNVIVRGKLSLKNVVIERAVEIVDCEFLDEVDVASCELVYPFDLFIPVVKLDVADQWQPFPQWRKVYSIFHKVLGWLLIPLLVASIAGILKRE